MPGQGLKKPLNMLEQPVYPDIKQAPPEFKWSKKHWVVDAGQTILDTEANTQLYEHAVLAQSRDHGRDRYGHSSYQEKIDAFRPPLENSYEHHGPLNRLPTKVHSIQPRINPGTAHGGHGTSGFVVQNQTVSDINKHLTDRITTNSWRATFYAPMDMPEDNSVLPDLETTMPLYSVSAGCDPQVKIDAPVDVKPSNVQKLQTSASSGFNVNYKMAHTDQTNTEYTILDTNLAPMVSGDAGYKAVHTIDGETKLNELNLDKQIDSHLTIVNPGSETGYQTRLKSYTSPQDHIKLKQNPNVSVTSQRNYEYRDKNSDKQNFYFKTKIEPVKGYATHLNGGTFRTSGVEQPNLKLKYDHMKNNKKRYN